VSGATVIFSKADGTEITHATTAADGKASAMVPAGTSVTAEMAVSGTQHILETVFDTQANDDIMLGLPSTPAPVHTPVGSVQVSFTGSVTNATNYYASSGYGCSGNGSTSAAQTYALDTACLSNGGTYDVFALATDSSGTPLAYATDVALVPPGSGNTAMITMPSWRTDFGNHQVAISNGVTNSSAKIQLIPENDSSWMQLLPDVSTTLSGTSATLMAPYPKSLGTYIEYNVQVFYPTTANGMAVQLLKVRGIATSITNDTLDLSTLPTLLSRQVTVPSGKTTPLIELTATGPAPATAGEVVATQWSSGGIQYVWYGALSKGETAAQFPDLPDTLMSDRVTSAQVFDQVIVLIETGTLFADLAHFRANFFPAIVAPDNALYNERVTAM